MTQMFFDFRNTSILLLAAAFLTSFSASAHAQAFADKWIVANNKMGSLTIIDPTSLKIEREIAVSNAFWASNQDKMGEINGLADDVAVLPDGDTVVMSRPYFSDVAFASLSTGEILRRIPIEGTPDHFGLAPDGKRLFVSVRGAPEECLAVIDTEKQEMIDCVFTWYGPHGVHFNKDGSRVFSGSILIDRMTEIDTKTLEVVHIHEFSEGVRPFHLIDNDKKMLLQLSRLHGFVVYDMESRRVQQTVHLPARNPTQATFPHTAHHGVSVAGDETSICIAGTVSHYTAILDYPTFNVKSMIDVGEEPSWTINSSDGTRCYVSSRRGDSVSVIDYASGELVKTIDLGKGRYPQRMWAGPVRTSSR